MRSLPEPLRSPIVLLWACGLVAVAAIVGGTSVLSSRAAATEAVRDARDITEVVARGVVEPEVPRGLVDARVGAVRRVDRAVLGRVSVPGVRRVKIWRPDGTIVYSDEPRLIGSRYALGDDELEALDSGRVDADVSDLSEPENRYERDMGGLLEVYTRIDTPEGQPLLLELYFSADAVARRQADITGQFRPVSLGAVGLVVLVATTLLYLLIQRLRHSAQDRERLLVAAVDASEAERGRIARDLHDGVVQDIAGASYAVFALSLDEGLPASARQRLSGVAASLRTSQGSLRSLMVEIYPPDLEAETLGASLQDLLAPAEGRGIAASAVVSNIDDVGLQSVRLVWRVAQEAVRNALRHSGAATLSVGVTGVPDADQVRLEVADDGSGFDREGVEATRFGLRGLSGLVADAGGRLDVDTEAGHGTTVSLVLDEAHR